MTTPTPAPPPDILLQRLDAEFQALNEAFGATDRGSKLMPASTLDVAAKTLTLPIDAPGKYPKANLLFGDGNSVVLDKSIDADKRTIKLEVTPGTPGVDERVGLVGVELTDAGLLTRMGVVRQAPPLFAPRFAPVSISTSVDLYEKDSEQLVISAPVSGAALKVGSTFRITIRGAVEAQLKPATMGGKSNVPPPDTTGWLKFTPYIGKNPSKQIFEMVELSNDYGPDVFYLEVDATVRALGSLGTYVTNGYGRIEFPTPVVLIPDSNYVGQTAYVDTDAASSDIKLTAQWQKARPKNRVLIDIATIEQVA